MKKAAIWGGAIAVVLVLLAVAAGFRALERKDTPAAPEPATPAAAEPATPAAAEAAPPPDQSPQGLLYGRITTIDGATFEGRLRWGGTEEAFWGDYFNGTKRENPWIALLPPEQVPKERQPISIFGIEVLQRERPIALGRLFMARFGDIAKIEASGRDVRVTLKSGTAFDLDRLDASDFDDGVRVWDGKGGAADLDSTRIQRIELLPTPPLDDVPWRLYGTVHTRFGDFTGFLQWDRTKCEGSDELGGRASDGAVRLRFDAIGSIARRSRDSVQVSLRDGRELTLSKSREIGPDNRGIYVDDARYGRVLISWDAFEQVDFHPRGSGPAYGEFPPGSPLAGSITTRAGDRLAGRLVFDLDESETTETLDAPSQGVNYTIPFGMVASIVLPALGSPDEKHGRVTLHNGEALELERRGDLGPRNAGMLVFMEGREGPEYVGWSDVERVDFDRPPAMYPPLVAPPGHEG